MQNCHFILIMPFTEFHFTEVLYSGQYVKMNWAGITKWLIMCL